jgi:hypothetical protein
MCGGDVPDEVKVEEWMEPHPPMRCKICRRPMEVFVERINGVVQEPVYQHHESDHADHAPVLEPNDDVIGQVSVCDFCSGPGVAWTFPAYTFKQPEYMQRSDGTIVETYREYVSVGDWAACVPCYTAIEADKWSKVWKHWVKHHPGPIAPSQQTVTMGYWSKFKAARNGPAYPLFTGIPGVDDGLSTFGR